MYLAYSSFSSTGTLLPWDQRAAQMLSPQPLCSYLQQQHRHTAESEVVPHDALPWEKSALGGRKQLSLFTAWIQGAQHLQSPLLSAWDKAFCRCSISRKVALNAGIKESVPSSSGPEAREACTGVSGSL